MKRYWHGAIALAMAACNQATLPSDPPSDYEFETPPPAPPTDAALVAAQLDPIIQEVLSLDPVELFNSYETERALGEPPTAEVDGQVNCPQYDMDRLADPADGFFAWDSRGVCDSTLSSARFLGSGESLLRTDFLEDDTDPNSAFINRAFSMGSSSRIFENRDITDGSGPRFEISMNMDYIESVPTQGSADLSTFGELRGSVFWNGAGSSSVWLSQRYSLDFDVESTVQGANKQARINGIVSGLQNPLIDAVIFNDVRMTLETFPDPNDPLITLTTCQQEPSGSFEVRDANGYWYRLSFQGTRDFGDEAGDQCDGIGQLIIINDPIFNPIDTQTPQPVTPTFTGLSSWGGRPWQ